VLGRLSGERGTFLSKRELKTVRTLLSDLLGKEKWREEFFEAQCFRLRGLKIARLEDGGHL